MKNPELHFSQLKHMAQSPAHYRYHLDHPPGETAAMRFGTLVHALVLGTDKKVSVYEGDRRGNAWKAWEEDHRDDLIVTVKEHATAIAAACAVKANATAMRLLEGRHEVTKYWTAYGRDCAGRIDVIGHDYVTELKTTQSAQPDWFARHARSMGYLAQLAWYAQACGVRRGNIVAVESKAPHAVTVFELTEDAMMSGKKQLMRWLEDLNICEQSDAWPAYSQAVVPLYAGEVELTFGDEDEEAA